MLDNSACLSGPGGALLLVGGVAVLFRRRLTTVRILARAFSFVCFQSLLAPNVQKGPKRYSV